MKYELILDKCVTSRASIAVVIFFGKVGSKKALDATHIWFRDSFSFSHELDEIPNYAISSKDITP